MMIVYVVTQFQYFLFLFCHVHLEFFYYSSNWNQFVGFRSLARFFLPLEFLFLSFFSSFTVILVIRKSMKNGEEEEEWSHETILIYTFKHMIDVPIVWHSMKYSWNYGQETWTKLCSMCMTLERWGQHSTLKSIHQSHARFFGWAQQSIESQNKNEY